MDKSRSWVNTHSLRDEVLSHEQVHFDISEIHARLLRQYFALNNRKSAGRNPESIYKKYINRLRRMQDDYDRQTNHGNDLYMQMMWEEKIKAMLIDLEQYSGQEMAWSNIPVRKWHGDNNRISSDKRKPHSLLNRVSLILALLLI